MQAVPAWSGWQTKSQPDGTTIIVRQLGDEFYSYWQTQDGKLAIQQADGTFVVSDAPVPTPAQVSVRRQSSPMYDRHLRKAAAKALTPPKGLAILVQFEDEKFQDGNDNQGFHDMLNKKGYSYNGATGSARDYFKAQSGGKYVPDFDVFGPVTLPHDVIYYGEHGDVDVIGIDGNPTGEKKDANDKYMADFVVDAVLAADAEGCDFSRYDSDGDGKVDIIYFFYAGKSEAEGGLSKTIWPHSWNLAAALFQRRTHGLTGFDAENLPELDGKTILNYVCSSELSNEGVRNGIGTFCHEFGHVLGLPDYYDTKYGYNSVNERTPGCWSIMDAGSYNNESRTPPNYSIYDKFFLGWATPKFLQKDADLDIVLTTDYDDAYQMTGGSESVDWNYAGKVYYVENRQQTGWDAYLPGHGMLIWEVDYDYDYWDQNVLNCIGGKPKYTVYSALRTGDAVDDLVRIGFDSDPFPGSTNRQNFAVVDGCALTDIYERPDNNIIFKLNQGGGTCRNVVTDITGCKFSTISCAAENVPLYVTFIPESEYDDITSLTVQVGSTTLTKGTDYVLSEDHKTLTVYPAAIKAHSGDITITATWEKVIMTYQFAMSIANCTYPSDGTCRLGEPLVLKITPDEGYTLRDVSCWGIVRPGILGGLIYGTDYTYNESTNELTVFSVPGNLYINPMPKALERWYADGNLYNEEIITSTSSYLPSSDPGNCSNGRKFVGWCKDADYHNLTIAPTYVTNSDSRDKDKPASYYAVYRTDRVPKMKGAARSINDATVYVLPTSYGSEGPALADENKDPFQVAQFYWDNSTKVLKWRGAEEANGAGFIYNAENFPTKIHSIVITYNSADTYRNISLKIGSSANPTSGRKVTPTANGLVYTFDCTDGDLCDYFVLTNGNHEALVERIDINLVTDASYYMNYSTRCDVTPAYVVEFYDEDGTKLDMQVIAEGEAATAPVLVKDCYNLTWDKDFSHVTRDMTVTADWRPKSGYKWSVTSNDESKGTIVFDPKPTCTDLTLHFSAVPKEGFGFIEWSDGVKDKVRTVTLTKDTVLVAKFAKMWKIEWYDDIERTKLLHTTYVPDGVMPEYPDGTPTRDDPEYVYKFDHWIPTIAPATEDCNYVASYSRSYRYYTVTFKDENGTVLGVDDDVRYEQPASAPYVSSRECYTYSWDKDFSKVTEDMTVNIIWTPAEFKYTFSVTSQDESMGTVTITKTPTCEDPTAEFRADAKEGYMFDGWSDWSTDNPRTMTIDYNKELTAKWVQAVKITWKNWDGEELLTEYVKYGTDLSYSGPTPTREPDNEYTYNFYGSWTPTIEKATKDAEYTAVFSKSTRWYTVTFQYEDGREIKKQEVTYGYKYVSAPKESDGLVIPECMKVTWDKDFSYITEDLVVTAHFVSKIPNWEIKNSDETQGRIDMQQEPTCDAMFLKFEAVPNDGCEFLKWSDGDEHTYRFFYLSKDTVITALWVKKWTITWNDEDGSWLKTTRVKNGEKPSYGYPSPSRDDAQYTYYFNGWTPTIVPATEDAVYTATYLKSLKQYTVRFYDDNYNVIKTQPVEYGKSATAPTDFKPSLSSCQEWSGWDKDFSFITGNLDVHPKITDKPLEYKYSVESSDPNKGTVTITYAPTSACDTKLSFEAKANDGYEFLKWSDGSTANPRTTYLMGDVNITALWQEKAAFWTITWKNGDQVLEIDENVANGEKPEYNGAIPTKDADAEFTYTWSGWTPEVVPATANATYTATFKATKNKYTVIFMDGEKKVGEDNVEYGSPATPPEIEIPDCKLLTWAPDYSNITGNLTVYAQWSDKPLEFSWSATSADDKMGKVHITHEPTCSDPKLTAYAMATSGYKFDKWSDGETRNPYSLTVDKNIALVAQWIPTWTIVWKNGDEVLETDNNVPNGTTPTYDGAEPTKAADAEFTYTFSGWTPEVVPATANATYTATFKATKNKYTVTFMDGDKKVGEDNVEYGSSATPPEIEIPDCKLLTWAPDYSNITGNLTVYAQWADKPLGYTYEIHVSDKKMGSCTISKSPTCSSPTLTVRADANDGYRFVKWSDGATENPYTVTVDKNIELTAIFEEIEVEPVEVTGDTDIKDIVTDASTEIEVTPEAHLTVSTATTIHSITLEYSESGHAQLSGITNLTVDEIEVKMQFPTPIGPLDEQWFAIAVPFAVSMATGIRYEGSDKPAIPGTDFIVEEYDGALRATTQRGWKSVKADATLYPGHMYMISMASHATWYLKAADPKTLSEPTSVGISAYDSKIGAHHSGWNGIANTLFTCASGDAAGISYATTFNNKKGVYEAQATGSYVFGAAVPFFVQTAAGGVLNFTDESGTPAPLRAQYAQSSSIAAVTLSDGNYTDKAFWTVNADKQDVYTIGSDLQKMQVANAGVPQISILAYNMKLSAYEAPFDGTATIPVSLYAPAEGTYSIAVSNVPDDLNVLLMRNGNLVWDITSSPYAADLQAGDNSGYSLYVQRIKEMGTGVNNNGNETHNVQKVLFNDRIYIIRDGRTYVITGECVKE